MNFAGEYEGAAAHLMCDQMPRNALRRKACGERSEDFCAACGTKVTAFRSCRKDFFDSCGGRRESGALFLCKEENSSGLAGEYEGAAAPSYGIKYPEVPWGGRTGVRQSGDFGASAQGLICRRRI